ncbi:MAG: hypothetical protein K9G24_05825 [Candidatus Nanopelagicales bacterium]|nr:hypothetical protein [Candidatus Nanopelagicales bacterium]MCF8537844.1 hypothetical protein [Candidatus Nanopelagicales bacterium]MCF8542586.1 hypothetical protein [Candidatus Nanopelagicales bacterium]MCF8557702.1 hypothetical protein [Candidatus Nanopelagicales bacterium]
MANKYVPVTEHLRELASNGQSRTEMLFGQLDRLVGGLPPTARKNRTWWANNSQSQALAWRRAGWHVASVDFAQNRVTFEVGEVGGSYAVRKAAAATDPAAPRPRPAPASRPSLDVDALPEMDPVTVSVAFTWLDAGSVVLDKTGKLRFPGLPPVPGLYRMALHSGNESIRTRWYIGESDNLRRRSGNYRNPGGRQHTSIRINSILTRHLQEGGTVSLAIAVAASVDMGSGAGALDLTRKAARLLAENAALGVARDAAMVDIENLG